jgi:hypothetical protein
MCSGKNALLCLGDTKFCLDDPLLLNKPTIFGNFLYNFVLRIKKMATAHEKLGLKDLSGKVAIITGSFKLLLFFAQTKTGFF